MNERSACLYPFLATFKASAFCIFWKTQVEVFSISDESFTRLTYLVSVFWLKSLGQRGNFTRIRLLAGVLVQILGFCLAAKKIYIRNFLLSSEYGLGYCWMTPV